MAVHVCVCGDGGIEDVRDVGRVMVCRVSAELGKCQLLAHLVWSEQTMERGKHCKSRACGGLAAHSSLAGQWQPGTLEDQGP